MTPATDRVAAIVALGYTEREAAFLVQVARHSGYFVRRQFLQCIGRATGQTVVDFTRKLLWRRHATLQTFCHATQVVHLSARSLYVAADAIDRRDHRRRRPAVAIKARLMALDYVLGHPELRLLATEAERVAYGDAIGVDRLWLPQQRYASARGGSASVRYFVDAGLMGLDLHRESEPCPIFAYVDDGDATAGAFETYLRRHLGFWAALRQWCVVYVADRATRLTEAETTFHRVCADAARPAWLTWDLHAFLDYCRLRRAFDGQQWTVLDKPALDRFRELRARFAGHDGDRLYGQWESRGDGVVRHVAPAPPASNGGRRGTFESCVLTQSYLATSPIGGRR